MGFLSNTNLSLSEMASLGEESAALQAVDENSCSSHVSASDPLRGPEEPDLADRSSRSSFTSLDDSGDFPFVDLKPRTLTSTLGTSNLST